MAPEDRTARIVGGPTWPAMPLAGSSDTRDTFHLYLQVIGKIRIACDAPTNHWWNSTMYLTSRGLTTSLMPHPTGPAFQIDFDLVDHELIVDTVAGRRGTLTLEPRSVADFYLEVHGLLDDLGVATDTWPVPVELPDAIPFLEDHQHASYDPEAVHRFWRALVAMDLVSSWWAVLVVPAALLIGLAFGGICMALTTWMRSWQDFEWVNLAVIPMFLFSATFFPVEALPPFLQPLAWLTPLYHGAVLARGLSLGTFGTNPTPELALIHLAILLGFIVVGTWAAIRTIDARLVRG